MNWNTTVTAFAVVSLGSLLIGIFSLLSRKSNENPLADYFLGNQMLEQKSVIQLLLSISFSLNGILYQIWLGYSIGLWGLAVQFVWALSYVWLSTKSESIRENTSLHSFLAVRFGTATKVLASICSIIGFTILIGWEFNVGMNTFEGILWSAPPSLDSLGCQERGADSV